MRHVAGGKWESIQPRLSLWANRFEEVKSHAMQMGQANGKLKWVISPEKETCRTCQKLSNKVFRTSTWRDKLDIYPRDVRPGKLACRGFNCGCVFMATDEPVSRGRLPDITKEVTMNNEYVSFATDRAQSLAAMLDGKPARTATPAKAKATKAKAGTLDFDLILKEQTAKAKASTLAERFGLIDSALRSMQHILRGW